MIEKQTAVLTLETYYLPTTQNNIGVKNLPNTNFTWNNINLRNVLGDMWDKYNNFNLSLAEITSTISPTVDGPTGENLIQNIYISGLPFMNATYDVKQKLNVNTSLLTTFTFGIPDLSNSKTYNGMNSLTFRKEQEQCSLNIFYKTVGIGSSPDSLIEYPNMTFIFYITGVNIDPDINMKSRMIK